MLTVAERSLDAQGSAFTAQAAALPGSLLERTVTSAGITQTEVFPLTLFATGGMMLFPAANDLLMMFVALEVLSLPLYLMCGIARRRRLLSQEAALKYFLLGAFSSAFFLYGSALLYGYAGTVQLGGIADAVTRSTQNETLLLIGTGMVAVGLLFKVGAAPFHAWTPDVYQGAPTPITGFMAAATKVAGFGALLRVLYVALGGSQQDWAPMIWAVAIITMVARVPARADPDRPQADARLLLHRPRRLPAHRRRLRGGERGRGRARGVQRAVLSRQPMGSPRSPPSRC